MNEHGLPPDELASAFLDDMLAEADADAVRADPNLAARAEELRRTTEAVGAPVDPPAGAADAAVAAALADYEARRVTRLDTAQQRRTRSFRLITAVAATVAVGFVVATAIGLFAERTQDDGDATAAPAAAPEPAPADMASAAAESAAPPPAPAAEPPAAAVFAASPPATTLPSPDIAMSDGGEGAVAQPGAALEEAQAAADLARTTVAGNEAAVAQAEAALADAQAEAAAAQAEAAAAPAGATESTEQAAAAPPPAPAPEPPPADDAMEDMPAMDDSGDGMDDMDDTDGDMGDMDGDMGDSDGTSADVPTDPSPESCAAEIADGTIELQITAAGTPILIVRTPDGRTAALDATTCAEIAPDDPTEVTVDPPPDGCAAAVGDGTIELQITAAGTPILIVRTPDGRTAALDATTCAEIAPEEPPDTSGDGTGDAAGPPVDSPT